MFDTRVVGQKIVSLRKKRNLTQMDLADNIGVSFQAVSNWERGNSMPDISKLPELASLFQVSIDELLGHSKETDIVANIVDKPEKLVLTAQELESVAPIMKPDKVDEYFDKLDFSGDMSTLMGLAPFVSAKQLENLIDRTEGEVEMMNLLPFLSKEYIDKKARFYAEQGLFSEVTSLAPFLSRGLLDELVDKYNGMDDLSGLYPFLTSESIYRFVKKTIEENGTFHLSSVAPFLKSDQLEALIIDYPNMGIDIQSLYPFLSSQSIQSLLDRWMKKQKE
ncbi:helix-turn-helix transcriptional regulator [Acidaminobacter sp. JC074]|uniref:helix-turn-helix domain-containing protein n=1 Tax=Acidaminobacter sp. JC074 TaxID=2530199 RepID=UPI001F0D5145|nr:helix-turn-helix transcriptional regulator [Acidaminobacter sp. JC074]MCH4889374.1 helix-turn-helix transcriptional regulator [Acidaminobacter sp. JC074]